LQFLPLSHGSVSRSGWHSISAFEPTQALGRHHDQRSQRNAQREEAVPWGRPPRQGVGEDEEDRYSVPFDESHHLFLDELTVPSTLAAEARLRIVADP
jgi:hypothetical protein